MALEISGVNENGGVSAPAVTAPITQTQAQIVESKSDGEGSKSADSLKTENKIPETVPYQRFKEVNEKAKVAEELANTYRENLEAFAAIQELAKENPKFAEEFKGVLNKYTGEDEPVEPKAKEPKDALTLLADEVKSLKDERIKEKRVSAVDKYDQEHELKASKEVPDELREAFDEMVARRVLAYSKGVPTAFNQKILDKAYDDAKKLFEPAMNKLKAPVKEEPVAVAANVPASAKGNAPVSAIQLPKTFNERRDLILRGLQSDKRLF